MAENMPCNSLPMAYVFIESPALLIILKTCNSTEIPPNPNKKLDDTMFTDIAFMCVFATKLTPFVSTTIPGYNASMGSYATDYHTTLRNADGSINMNGLFQLRSSSDIARTGAGAGL